MTKHEKELLYKVWGEAKAFEDELLKEHRYEAANGVSAEILTLNRLLRGFNVWGEFNARFTEARLNHKRF